MENDREVALSGRSSETTLWPYFVKATLLDSDTPPASK